MTVPSIPPGAVTRVSRGEFDPSRFAEVEQMNRDISAYLIPAIRQLDGLLAFYAGVSPTGSLAHVSIWRTDEHAAQLNDLREMVVDARRDAEAVGVSFNPITHYPIAWSI